MSNRFAFFNPAQWVCTAASGAATTGGSTVTGIATDDILLEVIHLDGATGAFKAVRTSEFSISAANTLANTTTDTSADTILVRYIDVSAG